MNYRSLGRTGISISEISFGAGPVSTLLVGENGEEQRRTIGHALARGVNWFDTAATYGDGRSEENLGFALAELDPEGTVSVATKVRFSGDDLTDVTGAVRRSVERSLERLKRNRITLLQLHNSVTANRGDEPTSVTPRDVLGPGGVLEAFDALRHEGLIGYLGITGIGQATPLAEVVRSGAFDTIQTPYHLLNPSAGRAMPVGFDETDYGNVIDESARQRMGVLAIRVMAGGALADNPPSPHTLKTPFFPLALYERDRARAAMLQRELAPGRSLPREAVRFALSHPQVHSAIIGFAAPSQIDEAIAAVEDESDPVDWDSLLPKVHSVLRATKG